MEVRDGNQFLDLSRNTSTLMYCDLRIPNVEDKTPSGIAIGVLVVSQVEVRGQDC